MKTISVKIQELLSCTNDGLTATFLVLFIYNRMSCKGSIEMLFEVGEDPQSIIGTNQEVLLDGIKPYSGTTKVHKVEQVQIVGAEF